MRYQISTRTISWHHWGSLQLGIKNKGTFDFQLPACIGPVASTERYPKEDFSYLLKGRNLHSFSEDSKHFFLAFLWVKIVHAWMHWMATRCLAWITSQKPVFGGYKLESLGQLMKILIHDWIVFPFANFKTSAFPTSLFLSELHQECMTTHEITSQISTDWSPKLAQ